MKSYEKSAIGALFNCFPNSYFLHNSVMLKAEPKWLNILERADDIIDQERIAYAVRRALRRADYELVRVQTEGGNTNFREVDRQLNRRKFSIRRYRQVISNISPCTFICQTCGYFVHFNEEDLAKGKIKKTDLMCHSCGESVALKQVVHIFTHSLCGNVGHIEPKSCPVCREKLKLKINYSSFGNSYWGCKNNCQLPTYHRDVWTLCSVCRELSEENRRMVPKPAGSAIKPCSLTMVDINSDLGWEEIARQRCGISGETKRQILRNSCKKPDGNLDESKWLAYKMILDNGNRSVQERLFMEVAKDIPELNRNREEIVNALNGNEPNDEIKRLLAEYDGSVSAVKEAELRMEDDFKELVLRIRNNVSQEFKIYPKYIDNLSLETILYGYQVGSSDMGKARILTFDQRLESYLIALKIKTEAILFELDLGQVSKWIESCIGREISSIDLSKHLIGIELEHMATDEIYKITETLLHTLSHLLIRHSELYTGLSRDSFSEMIFTPALAFLIYCNYGSELGALKATVSSHYIISWMRDSIYSARECANDPTCLNGNINNAAACHACLFLAERNCNSLWNSRLDRRLIVSHGKDRGYIDI